MFSMSIDSYNLTQSAKICFHFIYIINSIEYKINFWGVMGLEPVYVSIQNYVCCDFIGKEEVYTSTLTVLMLTYFISIVSIG